MVRVLHAGVASGTPALETGQTRTNDLSFFETRQVFHFPVLSLGLSLREHYGL
jgi:hypothetical protein